MRRYKIVAYIFLIFSAFSFVLAAPVAAQEVREAGADAVDGGHNVIIGLGKRADSEVQEEDPLLAAQQEPSSSTLSQHQGSSSPPNYASANNPNPSFSSGESKPATLSTSGGTELSWNDPKGEAKLIQPPLSNKAKSVSWASSKKVQLPSGEIYNEILIKVIKPLRVPPGPEPEGYQLKQPASPGKAKSVSFAPSREVILPSGETYSERLPSESKPLPRPLFLDLYQARVVAQQSAKPKSKNVLSKLADKVKFWRRISGTAGGVVTEG